MINNDLACWQGLLIFKGAMMTQSTATRQFKDYNQKMVKACLGCGAKPGTNTRLIESISRQETVKINIAVFDNGLWSVLGIDANGDKTSCFSCVPKSQDMSDFFGNNWQDKLNVIEKYSNSEKISIAELLAASE